MTSTIKFSRAWGMPSADTFDCKPIRDFVGRYMSYSKVSVDPFARNRTEFTYTNDLNPKTDAKHHRDARVFLKMMAMQGVKADIVLLDPPYSPRQISECYAEIGIKCSAVDTQSGRFYKEVKDLVVPILKPDAYVLSFGWNSTGMGRNRGFELVEVMLVPHGGAHNDTICMAEQYRPNDGCLFENHATHAYVQRVIGDL